MSDPVKEKISASAQNYLKAIYTQTRDGQTTSTVALADALAIRPASVTNMLQKLSEQQPELVTYRKHYGVTLTREGERAALEVIRRHRLLEQFLYQILSYPLDRIHQEADELEHAVSPYFIERIAKLMEDPCFDPHGDPIPDRDLILSDPRHLSLLSDLQPGEAGIVRQITDQAEDLLLYLKSIGVQPGVHLKILQSNPIDGTLQVEILKNDQAQVLGKTISENIQVEVSQH